MPKTPTARLRVRELREDRGWTQLKLAIESGITPTTISSVETGSHVPSLETLQAIADALGVAIQDLFPEPPRPPGRYFDGKVTRGEPGPGTIAAMKGATLEEAYELAFAGAKLRMKSQAELYEDLRQVLVRAREEWGVLDDPTPDELEARRRLIAEAERLRDELGGADAEASA